MDIEEIKLTIDLLAYLDTKLLWSKKEIDIDEVVKIIPGIEERRPDFKDSNKRHDIIVGLINKLEAML